MNSECRFCVFDKSKIFNTVLEESDNFLVIPALGSLVDGYVLIITKKHLYNMNQLDNRLEEEYFNLIYKYRNLFKKIYGRDPIAFEHGTSIDLINESASSVVHAHTHIVNHNYLDENKILKELNFEIIDNKKNFINDKRSYIYYMSSDGKEYITYNYKPVSQLMRIYIARDLEIEDSYDWKNDIFIDNIILTIDKFKNS